MFFFIVSQYDWSLGNVDVVTLMEVWLSYRLNLCLGSTLSYICDLCCSKYIYKCVCVCVCVFTWYSHAEYNNDLTGVKGLAPD